MATKAEVIRKAVTELGPTANNSDMTDFCRENYGVTITAQNLYEVLGSQSKRKLKQYNGAQLMDLKSTANRLFNGDYQEMSMAALALHNYGQ